MILVIKFQKALEINFKFMYYIISKYNYIFTILNFFWRYCLMGFRKVSSSILCATIGLGLSQNFAVSAAFPDEISLATGEENVLGAKVTKQTLDSFLNKYSSSEIILSAALFISVMCLICVSVKNSGLESRLENVEYNLRYGKFLSSFAKDCEKFKIDGKGVRSKIFSENPSVKNTVETILDSFKGKKVPIIKLYSYIIYNLYLLGFIKLKDLKRYEKLINDDKKDVEEKTSGSEKFLVEALGELCEDDELNDEEYKQILKKLDEEKEVNGRLKSKGMFVNFNQFFR